MSSKQPKGMAQAALDREAKTANADLGARAPLQLQIGILPLQDGRARLVDRKTKQFVGIAVNERVAERTRKFFQ